MNLSECVNYVEEEMSIIDAADWYMAKPKHMWDFCGCFIKAFAKEGRDYIFDRADMLDCDGLDIINAVEKDGKALVEFGFSYIMTYWNGEDCLARVTAYAKGKCSFPIKENVWYGEITILELENVEEEFDDMTMVN